MSRILRAGVLTTFSLFLVAMLLVFGAGAAGTIDRLFQNGLAPENWTLSGSGTLGIAPASGPTDNISFTYNQTTNPGEWYTWNFYVTANVTESLTFHWDYTWFHSWCDDAANLYVYNDGPAGSRTLLFSGYDSTPGSGICTIPLTAGHVFGFRIEGYHYDSARHSEGRLLIRKCTPAEISVTGNDAEIPNGDISPSEDDLTDFGTAFVDDDWTTDMFVINNLGESNLLLTGTPYVTITGDTEDFSVETQPVSGTVAGLSDSAFYVTFDPTSPGLKTATVSIANNDTNENPYTFTVQGYGLIELTVTGITAGNKVYDGLTDATINTAGAELVGVQEGDEVSLVTEGATGAFEDRNAGTGKTVYIDGLTLAGADADNYGLGDVTATANITQRLITVKAINNSKVYDGTTESTGAPYLTSGTLADDDTGDWTQTFNNRNVGTNKTLTPSGYVDDGNDGDNYSVTFVSINTGRITERAITVTAAADSRAYNGTTGSAGSPIITTGTLAEDDSAVWSQHFDTKDVGTGKTLTPQGTVTDGNSGHNYHVTFATVDLGTISQATLTVSGITAEDRYYDRTTSATLDTEGAELVGAVEGDDVSLDVSEAAGVFSNKNAGMEKTVTVSGLALTGDDAGSYSLTQPTLYADIWEVELTVSGVTANNKTYDATTDATVATGSASLNGVISGDTVTLNAAGVSADFEDADVGVGKTVYVSGLALGGADAANYTLTQPTLSANITPRAITVTAATGSRGYDGTANSSGTPTLTSGSLAGDDTGHWTQSYDNANAGEGKTLTPDGYVNDGNDGDNYTVTFTAVHNGVITPRALSVTAVADSKTYDGTTASDATPHITSGTLVEGDTPYWSQHFGTKNIGEELALIATGYVDDGNEGDNYAVTFFPANSGTITRATLTATGITASDKEYNAGTGAVIHTAGASLDGVFGEDDVSLDVSEASGAFRNKYAGTEKAVDISGLSLTGVDANNYTLESLTVYADITQKEISANGIDAVSKTYDGTTAATLNIDAGLNDVIEGDDVHLNTSAVEGAFSDANAGTGKTVTVTGLYLTGEDADNYTLADYTSSADITRRNITVTAATDTKDYDGTAASAETPSVTSGTLVAGDTGHWSQSFGTKNAGSEKTLTPTGYVDDGNEGANYNVTFVTAVGAITRLELTVGGITADSKLYDGNTTAVIRTTFAELEGVLEGDTVTMNTGGATGAFANKNVGAEKAVNISGVTIGGADAGNYTLTQPTVYTGILHRAITVRAVNNSKVYDGTTASSGVPTIIYGSLAGGDTAAWTQVFDNRNVGTGKTLTPEGSVNDGNDGDNYIVSFASIYTGTITKRAITVTADTDSRAYDGTTDSTGVPGITTGSLGTGDTGVWTQSFDNKNAGTSKTLTPDGYVQDGNESENYYITFADVDTGTITPLAITVTAVEASRTYDGTTGSASEPEITAGSVIEGDTAEFTQTYDTKNVGTEKTLTPDGYVDDGNDGDNYDVTFVPTDLGTITRATLTVSGITAADKEYDGTTDAAINTDNATLAGVFGEEDVNLDVEEAEGAFETAAAGTEKAVDITGLVITGDDTGNYTLEQPTVYADITPIALTVTGVTASNKDYDGTTDAVINTDNVTLVGVLDGDDVELDVESAEGAFENASPGVEKTVNISGMEITGDDVDNYTLTQPTATADILAPAMSVRGNGVAINDGDNVPSAADYTDFGNADIDSGTVVRTFTIRNGGEGNLNLTHTPRITIGGTNAAEFTVTAQPASPVSDNGSTTFAITFNPSVVGLRTATVNIVNNDPERDPYNFAISGVGTTTETGGSGGAGGALPSPGTTYLTGMVNGDGQFLTGLVAPSVNQTCWVTVQKDTIGLDVNHDPLPRITILALDQVPQPPAGSNIVSIPFNISPEGATFDPPVTVSIRYDQLNIPAGTDENSLVIAFYNASTNQWVQLTDIVVDAVNNIISGKTSHFSIYAVIANAPAATFTVSNLSVTPAAVNAGETVTVSAHVANSGFTAGNYDVALKVNGVTLDTKQVSLAVGAGQDVQFSVTEAAAGSYTVSIGSLTGVFTVREAAPATTEPAPATTQPAVTPPATQPAPTTQPAVTTQTTAPAPTEAPVTSSSNNGALIGGLVAAAVVVVGLVTYFIWRRRHTAG